MAPTVGTYVHPARDSARLQDFLGERLPYSLPLLRRLQYYDNSSEAVAVSTFDVEVLDMPEDFAIGFFDPQASTITCGIFSSLDVPSKQNPGSQPTGLDDGNPSEVHICLRTVFAHMKQRCAALARPLDMLFVGTVNAASAHALRHDTRFGPAVRDDLHGPGGPYDKYTFQRSAARAFVDLTLPSGFQYSDVRSGDYRLVLDNNNLVRLQDLPGRPAVCIREESSGLARAWAFYGSDGSIRTIHVMPDFRRRGFGRKVAVKCLLDKAIDFQDLKDDWVHTDVAAENLPSTKLFRGLGAELAWTSYWMRIDVTMIPTC